MTRQGGVMVTVTKIGEKEPGPLVDCRQVLQMFPFPHEFGIILVKAFYITIAFRMIER